MRGTLKKTLFFSVCFVLTLSAVVAKAQETIEEESAILPITEDIETADGELLIAPAPEPVIIEEAVDEAAIQTLVNEDTDISAEDLEVNEPTILPGNPFYFAKTWWRNIRNSTTFNPVKKAALRLQHANEKIIEAKILAEKSGDATRIEKAIENYQEELENIQERIDIIKEKNTAEFNKERLDNFLDKFTDNQIKQQKVIDVIAKKTPENIALKIIKAKENAINKLANIPLQFENAEQFQERLENKLESQAGSTFKNFKNLEILKEVEAKVPEQAKKAIQLAQENTFRRLENTMNNLQNQEKEQFKFYVEKIGGNEIRHIEIMHDFELREIPAELRTEIEKAKEKTFNAVQTKMENIQSEEVKTKFIEYLQDGQIKNIRIIKELENNLPQNTIEKIIEIKTQSLENFRKEIENSDDPDTQASLMTKMQEFHDVKQFEMFKEMDSYIPEDKQEFWGKLKEKAKNELEQKIQQAQTQEEKTRVIQSLAGDSPVHVQILQEFALPEEMTNALMNEQMEKLNLKIHYIENPERLQTIRETIENKSTIQNEVQKYNHNFLQKLDAQENFFLKEMTKEKAEAQIHKATNLSQKFRSAVAGSNQDIKNAIAGKSNFQNNSIAIQDKLKFAKQSFEQGNYHEAFELATTVINRINENQQIIQAANFSKVLETRDAMLIDQRKIQTQENVNLLQEKLNNVSGTEERQIRAQIKENQEVIQKLEAADDGTIGDKLRIIREEQIKEQINAGTNKAALCTMDWNPVCGKDGNTYSNLCVANNKGVQVDYNGECKKIIKPILEPAASSDSSSPVKTEINPTYTEPINKIEPAEATELIDVMKPLILWAF